MKSVKRALITGVTGQDGSYLSELLLEKGSLLRRQESAWVSEAKVFLGNLSAKRDWGHARDFVEGMWLTVQHDEADDFVLATGHNYSVRWFCERVFGALDMDLVLQSEGAEEKRRDRCTDPILIEVDPIYFRPTEVDMLIGDATKVHEVLGWEPHYSINTLMTEMVEGDLEIARRES